MYSTIIPTKNPLGSQTTQINSSYCRLFWGGKQTNKHDLRCAAVCSRRRPGPRGSHDGRPFRRSSLDLLLARSLTRGHRRRAAERIPWNLINGREKTRHQKAIDVENGEVVGYARWYLPPVLTERKKNNDDDDDDNVVWQEAQVAEPTPEERELFERRFKTVTDNGRIPGLRRDVMMFRSAPLEVADAKIMKDGPYLSKLSCSHRPMLSYERNRRSMGLTCCSSL